MSKTKEYYVSLSDEIKAAYPNISGLSVLGGVRINPEQTLKMELGYDDLKYGKRQTHGGIKALKIMEGKDVTKKSVKCQEKVSRTSVELQENKPTSSERHHNVKTIPKGAK